MENSYYGSYDGPKCYTDEEGYQREIPKRWNSQNAFVFESKDLEEVFAEVHPGNCVLTEEMKKFNPPEELIQYGESLPQRLIYYPKIKIYEEFENEKLKEFKSYCKSNGYKLPELDEEIFRALHKKLMDVPKAYESIMMQQKLVRDTFPMKVNAQVFDIINKGFMYICGRDKQFRPIMIIQPAVIFSQIVPNPPLDDVMAAQQINFNFYVDNMTQLGSVENLITVINQKDMNLFNMDYNMMNGLVQRLSAFSAGRSRALFILNADSSFNMLYNMICVFLPESVQQKIKVTNEPSHPELLSMVDPSQLEQRFGGIAQDRHEGDYWPPRLNE